MLFLVYLYGKTFLMFICLQFHGGDINEAVDDCVDGEAGRRVDLQLAGDVAAMGDDGVDRDEQAVGNLFVLQPLHHADDDILLAVAERIAVVLSTLEHHRRDVFRHIVLSR